MRAAIAALHAADAPTLIGVRHHSAVLARVVPQLLDRIQPETVLIELPADLQSWLEYVADEQTVAPIAISAVPRRGGMFFYPLADFSPELVAIRWARQHGVPVVACDLAIALGEGPVEMAAWDEPASAQADRSEVQPDESGDAASPPGLPSDPSEERLLEHWLRHSGASDTGDLWQRLVESPGVDADAETIRRAALTFGWAVRTASPPIDRRDRLREAAMRQAIRRAGPKSVAVIGAFHAPALLPEMLLSQAEQDQRLLQAAEAAAGAGEGLRKASGAESESLQIGVSLIPYSFAQLDERSGYPAGILDPVWHQRMLQAADRAAMERAATELVTDICRQLRSQGHVAGTPDATETIRMMRDLARLRGLVHPGRGELIEALQSCLVQGDPFGRGRAVAAAAEPVLIGNRQGRVTPLAPRCGLSIAIEQELAALKLPGPDSSADARSATSRSSRSRSAYRGPSDAFPAEHEKELSLDVLRKPRDRARAVMLRRLCAAGIPYARRVDTVQTGWRENLLERWIVGWQQGTSATIDSLSRLGVTLPQVVAALVRDIGRTPGAEAETLLPETVLRRLEIAAECGLAELTLQTLRRLDRAFRDTANISQLVSAATILTRVKLGWMPGLPADAAAAYPPVVERFRLPEGTVEGATLLRIALDRLEGLSGSKDAADVQAVAELIGWFTGELATATEESVETTPGRERLLRWCQLTLRGGSERMRGAAAGALAQLDHLPPTELAALLQGWIDGATDRSGRRRLQQALAGLSQVLLSRMQSEPAWLDGMNATLASLDDSSFLERLPALRGGFAEVSPADRARLLELRLAELTERGSALDALVASGIHQADPEQAAATIARCRAADLAGREAVVSLFPELEPLLSESDRSSLAAVGTGASPQPSRQLPAGQITLADRWRMILGVPPQSSLPAAQRASASLDQLYGRGRGEGSRGGLARRPKSGVGGGTEAPQPSAAQWAEDLESLFGSDVCQEVLGEAATAGRVAAVELLDAESVQPSVELLQQVLALAGSVPEAKLQKLRQLARRITEQLARQLAVRLQAALSGLSTPRPTRRRNRRLNLPRTIRANLAHCHRRSDGRPTIIAEQLIFNAPAKRQMDWHLTFVVDVSGSMSASVVYSALVAAILDALPALSVRFLTFSTEVIDLSAQVEDPLSLLLDVQIGGGTNIGLGLRAARAGIKVPSRSIVVLVSDFEEGVSVGQMLAEVRALVDAGVKCLGLAALDDTGVARFHQGYAQMMASVGMAVAAVSPEKLASWVGDQIRGSATGAAPR